MAQLHDLFPAAEPVGHHDRHRPGGLDRGQQALPGNRLRDFELVGFKPERTRHAAASGFDQIDRRAPENFRRTVPRKETVITARLPQYSGMIESIKEKFLFIRSGSYPRRIFAHSNYIDPDILEFLSIGQEVYFNMRFNRQGPTAVDVRSARN